MYENYEDYTNYYNCKTVVTRPSTLNILNTKILSSLFKHIFMQILIKNFSNLVLNQKRIILLFQPKVHLVRPLAFALRIYSVSLLM